MEKPHSGLDDRLNMLLSCFRNRISAAVPLFLLAWCSARCRVAAAGGEGGGASRRSTGVGNTSWYIQGVPSGLRPGLS